MVHREPQDATSLLERIAAGDARATDELLPIVYGELRALAASYMKDARSGHTLQPTALVNEAYMRLVGAQGERAFANRGHFLAVAARAMRSVLVDHSRRKRARKRGEAAERIPLEDVSALFEERVPDLLALDTALARLDSYSPEMARIVELRFFGGLSVEQAAEVLDISTPTLTRKWRTARIWLKRELAG